MVLGINGEGGTHRDPDLPQDGHRFQAACWHLWLQAVTQSPGFLKKPSWLGGVGGGSLESGRSDPGQDPRERRCGPAKFSGQMRRGLRESKAAKRNIARVW